MVNESECRARRVQLAFSGRADVEGECPVVRAALEYGSAGRRIGVSYTSISQVLAAGLGHIDVESHLVADIVVGDDRGL